MPEGANATSAAPLQGVERFVCVLEGAAIATAGGESRVLDAEGFAFFPAGLEHTCASPTVASWLVTRAHSLSSAEGAVALLYEQRYVEPEGAVAAAVAGARPAFLTGTIDEQPLVPVAPEVFELRKLLPTSLEYDFNMHARAPSAADSARPHCKHHAGDGFRAGRVSHRQRGALQPARSPPAGRPGHLSLGRPVAPRHCGRRRVDVPLRGPVVRRAGQDSVEIHH